MNQLAQDPELLEMIAEIKMLKLAINGIEDPADLGIIQETMQGLPEALDMFSSMVNTLQELINVCEMKKQQLTAKV